MLKVSSRELICDSLCEGRDFHILYSGNDWGHEPQVNKVVSVTTKFPDSTVQSSSFEKSVPIASR
jgi:hypothetical protein